MQRKGNLHLTPFAGVMSRLKAETAVQAKEKGCHVSMNRLAIGYIVAGVSAKREWAEDCGEVPAGDPITGYNRSRKSTL